jgi:thiamine biosynthesis protein ThiS
MLRVNDKWNVPWYSEMTVKQLLEACGFTHHHLVVSINSKLVSPGDYATQLLADGAQVRVVHVIGGG